MIYGLYHSAAGMMTNEYRTDVIANNIANADTVGFKRQFAVFAERQPAADAGQRSGPSAEYLQGLSGGLWLGRTHTDFESGPPVRTDRPLDVALEGRGFLSVQKDGAKLFTRDGRLLMDPAGRLVAATDGAPVLGRGGVPIVLNPLGGSASIDDAGRIMQDNAVAGWLEVSDFDDYAALRHAGAGRYDAGGQTPIAPQARVLAGHVENSAVEPVSELVQMIEASRAYQMNAQMISLQDQTAARLISVVTRA